MFNWIGLALQTLSRLPLEKLIKFKPSENPLRGSAEMATAAAPVAAPAALPAPAAPAAPAAAPPTPGQSALSSEELIAYQNRELGRELWLLERHLSQGCRIPDRKGRRTPCDCCAKGSFIAGMAYESIPIAERIGLPSKIYHEIAQWAEKLEPKVTVPAITEGGHDYKKLSGEASMLRKKLMGTISLKALDGEEKEAQIKSIP